MNPRQPFTTSGSLLFLLFIGRYLNKNTQLLKCKILKSVLISSKFRPTARLAGLRHTLPFGQ
jgi:hypothetical protein